MPKGTRQPVFTLPLAGQRSSRHPLKIGNSIPPTKPAMSPKPMTEPVARFGNMFEIHVNLEPR
jgi:hypothetical protein